ncbi:hypothetical protein JCM19314_2204 [Nonlabens ulvanivorans]|uniref:Uncharacterized protein n=1 Tax=Nonlabens ulvanivorans TaxID=906888 RepID=A0A081DG35_NONUL|nr:hypothetical protein JCM19296_3490 [Nonlabens ulvanivorans]GAL01850.1 hypothetical protein JCM19314_2204 [Nonlabens ulvanivorans]
MQGCTVVLKKNLLIDFYTLSRKRNLYNLIAFSQLLPLQMI